MKNEPEWWVEARALREQGLSTGQIGKRLGRSWNRIRYALDEPARRDEREAARARYWRRVG